MDEYLSEKEQVERIREWFRENGWYIASGIALGALAIFGMNQYRSYSTAKAEAAASLYVDLQEMIEDDDRMSADALLAELRETHPSSPYTDHAGMLYARSLLGRDDARAGEELRFVMENTKDRELALVARLRLARVLIHLEQFDDAIALLQAPNPGEFAAQFAEVRGDAHFAAGDHEAARLAYSEALSLPGADWLNRNFVEMKLDSLLAPQDAVESDA